LAAVLSGASVHREERVRHQVRRAQLAHGRQAVAVGGEPFACQQVVVGQDADRAIVAVHDEQRMDVVLIEQDGHLPERSALVAGDEPAVHEVTHKFGHGSILCLSDFFHVFVPFDSVAHPRAQPPGH
jgi:hypothetical protein